MQFTFVSIFLPLLIVSVFIFCTSLGLLIAKRKTFGNITKVVFLILLIISSIPILFSIVFVFGLYNQKSESAEVYRIIENMENSNYDFTEKTELIVDNRFFKTEDIPKNIPEEIVIRDFLYTITAEFDKKYAILADVKSHVISIENEKRLFEEGVFVKTYIIHGITTLAEKQYSQERTISGEMNPLFFWGWQQRVNDFELIEYQIVNVDFTVIFSIGGNQWGDGTYNRSFIVGKNSKDTTYRIYDFGVVLYKKS